MRQMTKSESDAPPTVSVQAVSVLKFNLEGGENRISYPCGSFPFDNEIVVVERV
jgi:hypothetical protein